jgi:hypothetical protein
VEPWCKTVLKMANLITYTVLTLGECKLHQLHTSHGKVCTSAALGHHHPCLASACHDVSVNALSCCSSLSWEKWLYSSFKRRQHRSCRCVHSCQQQCAFCNALTVLAAQALGCMFFAVVFAVRWCGRSIGSKSLQCLLHTQQLRAWS